MYVIAMKNRQCERLAISSLMKESLLRDDMMPLIEIIKDKPGNLIDPETGKCVTIPKKIKGGKIRNEKVKDLDPSHAVTLPSISEFFNGKDVFVDYFRCDLKKYDYDATEVGLVIELTLNLDKYKKRILEIADYPNLIPVIAVKHGIDMLTPNDIENLAFEIRSRYPNHSIAIRIDGLAGYEKVIEKVLTADDYLIYDFNENQIKAKVDECMKLRQMRLQAHTIALCSPRPRNAGGKDFPHGKQAKLINNSHLECYKQYGFDSVGDYGGLREKLPKGGIANNGRALALIYLAEPNYFKSFVCDDVKMGSKGFRHIMPDILGDPELNPDGACLALNRARESYEDGKDSTYGLWIQYTLMRYLQQLATKHPLFI